jgi:hypothetical protein
MAKLNIEIIPIAEAKAAAAKARKRPSSQKRDFMQVAREVVEQAIGVQMDGTPLASKAEPLESSPAGRGRLGGLKGGRARALALTPRRRRAIAKKAATKRWKRSD